MSLLPTCKHHRITAMCDDCGEIDRLEAEVERLRAENAAMFRNLDEQTTNALFATSKWQQAEARLAKIRDEATHHCLSRIGDHSKCFWTVRVPYEALAAAQPEVWSCAHCGYQNSGPVCTHCAKPRAHAKPEEKPWKGRPPILKDGDPIPVEDPKSGKVTGIILRAAAHHYACPRCGSVGALPDHHCAAAKPEEEP